MGCFGEIIEPSSRALWEDFEDDDEEFIDLIWEKQCAVPADIELLLLMEGALAVEFAKTCLITTKPIDAITQTKVTVYQIPNSNIVICTSLNDDDTKFGEITLLLRPWLEKSRDVICVQSLSATRYQNVSLPNSGSIIRSLQTVTASRKAENKLEQPNILSGLTAGVVSLRDHLDLPGKAYAVYTDTPMYGMDSTNTQPFENLLNHLNIPIAKAFSCKVNVSSNLYIARKKHLKFVPLD